MRHAMNRSLLLALLSLFLTFGSHPTRGGSITYTFPDEVASQNGHDMIGSFTTDGKIGALSSSDILSWSITVTDGFLGYTFAPAYGIAEATGVVATASGAIEILVPPGEGGGVIYTLGFAGTNTPGNTGEINWSFSSYIDNGQYPLVRGYDTISPYGGVLWSDSTPVPSPGQPWVIAQASSVPEPGTLTLALLGGSCLAVVRWRRRHRRVARSPQVWRVANRLS
jgi:PEP-CTERM motif